MWTSAAWNMISTYNSSWRRVWKCTARVKLYRKIRIPCQSKFGFNMIKTFEVNVETPSSLQTIGKQDGWNILQPDVKDTHCSTWFHSPSKVISVMALTHFVQVNCIFSDNINPPFHLQSSSEDLDTQQMAAKSCEFPNWNPMIQSWEWSKWGYQTLAMNES